MGLLITYEHLSKPTFPARATTLDNACVFVRFLSLSLRKAADSLPRVDIRKQSSESINSLLTRKRKVEYCRAYDKDKYHSA